MSQQTLSRGGATVGNLSALPPVEAGAVMALRHWFSGPQARLRLEAQFAAALGPEAATDAVSQFSQLCQICLSHGRRPLVRHGLKCDCLGADENVFANLIAAACEGEKADAMMMATLIVQPTMAPGLMSSAIEFGLALKQMTEHSLPLQQHMGTPATLH